MPRHKPPSLDLSPTSLPPDHRLVLLGPRQGSNNFTSTDPQGVSRLVELGSKLRGRGAVLVARGDYAFVKLFPPDPKGKGDGEGRLVGEIVQVLSDKEVREFKKAGEWPQGFGEPEPIIPPTPQGDETGYESDEEYVELPAGTTGKSPGDEQDTSTR